MKKLLFASFLLFIIFPKCDVLDELEEEEIYYEPIINEILDISVDESQATDFVLHRGQSLSISGKFDVEYIIDFTADVLSDQSFVEAKVKPIAGIQNLPSQFQFQFGFVFSPAGTYFAKPGKLKFQLANINFSDLKVFYFDGGDNSQIWNIRLAPLEYENINGIQYAVVDVPHFSGAAAVTGGDIECGNPLAAYECADIAEIAACYIVGKQKITSSDRNKINNAIKTWFDAGLKEYEKDPTFLDEEWEVEMMVQELTCVLGTILTYNDDLSSYTPLLERVGALIETKINKRLQDANSECLSYSDCDKYYSYYSNRHLLNLLIELNSAGVLSDSDIDDITHFTYCGGYATRTHEFIFMEQTSHISLHPEVVFYNPNKYILDFNGLESYTFTVYGTNLLNQEQKLELGVDYEIISINDSHTHTMSGNTITKVHRYNLEGNRIPWRGEDGKVTIKTLGGCQYVGYSFDVWTRNP